MILDNSSNLDYRHNESGKLYTLLYRCNETANQEELNESGVPKWLPTACYRSHETAEIFSRPLIEFEEKFTMVFPELENSLELDFRLLKNLGLLNEKDASRRLITLLGVAKELWSLFPIVKEHVRVGIIRSLNFTDYLCQIDDADTFTAAHLGSFAKLPKLFAQAGATLGSDGTEVQLDPSIYSKDIGLAMSTIMVGVASSVRELKFLNAITVEEGRVEEHRLKQEVLVESIQKTAEWLLTIGVNTALPNMQVVVNSYDGDYLQKTIPVLK